jgi:FkbM family methyltransferase
MIVCSTFQKLARTPRVNQLERFARLFDDIEPWSGSVPRGFIVDYYGVLIDAKFRALMGVDPSAHGGSFAKLKPPTLATHDEGWFEIVNWTIAAREARDRFTMMTLGACHGFQAVGSYKALMALNPMPARMVVVEPEPDNLKWAVKHFIDNDIDPNAHWFLQMAVSISNEASLFPVGSPGTGAQNFMASNPLPERQQVLQEIIKSGRSVQALRSVLLENRTGVVRDLVPGEGYKAELRFVSSITLSQILAPFDFVDFVEIDIQGAEIMVIPPALPDLGRKVRRMHLGTHGDDVHDELKQLYEQDGWEIVFSYKPMRTHQTPLGEFRANDGILTVRNPRF